MYNWFIARSDGWEMYSSGRVPIGCAMLTLLRQYRLNAGRQPPFRLAMNQVIQSQQLREGREDPFNRKLYRKLSQL